ncbi:hypothetical protein AN189_12490 [Loktanella sp. 3ANDIMAR09]|nr:hypothetical protein AN189_12490 [Loktanella sp. 3ANDIMAR09]
MSMERIFAARDQRPVVRHARQEAGCRQWWIEAQVDMATSLDKRHPRGRALGLEEGLRRSNPGGEGRLLCGGKVPPARQVTTGCEGETRAVAD